MTIDVTGISPPLRPAVLELAAQMRADGCQRSDPAREIPALLGDRWTSLILLVLDMGRWRHADLRRVLGRLAAEGRISQRVMTEKLRTLERNGFVRREATADVPPKVSYELTPVGRSLAGEARRLISWVHAHRAEIDSARTAFDADRDLDPQPR